MAHGRTHNTTEVIVSMHELTQKL